MSNSGAAGQPGAGSPPIMVALVRGWLNLGWLSLVPVPCGRPGQEALVVMRDTGQRFRLVAFLCG